MITKQTIEEVHVQYTVGEDGYIYQGVLEFTPEEYAKQTDKTMDVAIMAVYDKWMEHMLAPIPAITDEDKQDRLDQIAKEKAVLIAEADKLTAELVAVEKPIIEVVARG